MEGMSYKENIYNEIGKLFQNSQVVGISCRAIIEKGIKFPTTQKSLTSFGMTKHHPKEIDELN